MLSEKEKAQLKELLRKAKRPELDQAVFAALVKMIPFIACEMVVVNRKKGILLIWRDDEYWQGWHFPGGLLRYGETFEKRLKKVAEAELGAALKSFEFLFVKNYLLGKRGHDVSVVFKCALESQPKEGIYFSQMPKDIINEHKDMWKEVKKKFYKK